MAYARVDLSKYAVISIWFGCNNKCSICMLPAPKAKLPPLGFDRFREVVTDIVHDGRYQNLILSGAEVTTHDELDNYVQFASSFGWFRKIQIQTNGRKLNDKNYLKHLIDCGVNEFFVSMHGPESVHDAVTGVSGSFKETVRGLRNLEAFDVNVISNTVLTKANFHDIVPLMFFLAKERISEVHMWNFFPMERSDSRDLILDLKDFIGLLPGLLSIMKKAGKAMVLKSFPECLSIGEPGFFDSLFPVTVLPDVFWREFSECGFGACIHRDTCKAAQCWGLSTAYIRKYGGERALLSPRS
jgi:MoaA/NifB/PqqE/SkfB family radical SAM enzyme